MKTAQGGTSSYMRRAGLAIGGLCLVRFLLAASAVAQSVTLTDNGTTFTLSNGIVSATVGKNNGNCTDFRLGGGANILANGGKLYFDANGSTDGGSSVYVNFTPDFYRVVTNTSQRVETALTDTSLTGFNAELHYVMRAGDSGFYVYTVWRHGPGNPTAMLEQSRMVLRCDPNIFTHAYSSESKMGQMIAPSLLHTNISPMIMDATYQLPPVSSYTNATGFTEDGNPVYTKYDWCDYMENHPLHGVTSDNVGLWMLFGSVEYFNGGPTKANLLLHGTDTTPVLLWDFHAQHFGGSKINKAANEAWEKIMGPYFIYVNSSTNTSQLWLDAQQQAAVEQAAWPYDWVNETNYPLARGTVSGTLHITVQSTSNALVVLAQPGAYWQLQSEGYQFWTRAQGNGDFSISKVRPGTYTLYSHVPGVAGELQVSNVVVTASLTNNLGVINWAPPRRQQLLWRVGTPDLSAGEFRFGDRMRQFGLWWRYMEEQGTNDLIYTIGSSVTTNWYYAQSVVAMDDGTYFCPKWQIQFVLTNLPPAPAVLTVDMAGAVGGTFLTSVNGTSLSNLSLTSDGGIYRSAIRSGCFSHNQLTFDPSLLQVGTNVIGFLVSTPGPWTNSSPTKPVSPGRGVMYDCVQLEAGASVTASNLVWRGDGVVNAWDSVSSNWFDGVTTVPFLNGDDVVFDDSGSNAPPINLPGFLSPGSVTVNASRDYTFGGSGSLGGPMALFKSGSGQLILTTSNTFSGGTTISNGTLLVNNTIGSGTGTGAVTVASTGKLGGTGVIAGPVTVNGTLAPGSPDTGVGVGTLTVSNNLVVNAGAVLAYELGAASDKTVVASNLTLTGTLNVSNAGGFTTNTYILFSYGKALTYSGVAIGSAPAGYACAIDTNTTGQVKLVVTALTPFQQWRMQYFNCTNCPQAAASADPDGDGMINTNEFMAGTNPTNSMSGLWIISVVQQSNDVVITWTTAGGHTNAVQATGGDANGGYITNFVDITTAPHIIISGSGDATTNYVDVGGATNTPARYYRIRLVP